MFSRPHLTVDGLGPLARIRGAWRGTVVLGGDETALSIPGPRRGPDDEAVELARSIAGGYPQWAAAIRDALADHADQPDLALPRPVHAAIVHLDRVLTIELGYLVPGDDDHTVGVRLQQGRIVECNGSV